MMDFNGHPNPESVTFPLLSEVEKSISFDSVHLLAKSVGEHARKIEHRTKALRHHDATFGKEIGKSDVLQLAWSTFTWVI